jgi:uncharacterized delta-60 repeat protein
VQGDGKLLIGGSFDEVNGVRRPGIARLNVDGTLDGSFQNGSSGAVSSIAVQSDGKVLIGRAGQITRLNSDGTLDTNFQVGLSEGVEVYSFRLQSDGRVVVGVGFFDVNAGYYRNGIVRLNADGTLDRAFQEGLTGPGSVGWINSIAIQTEGKVLLGGNFETVNGVSRNRIARLNSDGTLDSAFQNEPGINGAVTSVAVQSDGKVIIAGGFRSVTGVSRNNIARLNSDGTLDSAFQNGLPGFFLSCGDCIPYSSVAVQRDGKVLVGGFHGIARLNSDGTLDSGFQNGLAGVDRGVKSVAMQSDGKVIIAGGFSSVNGVSRNGIARLNADGTLDSGFLNGLSGVSDSASGRGYVWSLAVESDDKVVIGGAFDTVNGQSRSGIARLSADGTLDSGFQNVLCCGGEVVYSVAIQSDAKVLVGTSGRGIARLNANGTLDTRFLGGFYDIDPVWSVAVQSDGKVIIGGHGGIARFNADGTLDIGFQRRSEGAYSVAVQSDGKVIVAGGVAEGIARLWGADYPPQIKSISQSGAHVNLSWYSISNRTYHVQYKQDLSAINWIDLAGDISATAATASKTDTTLGNANQRFYRVVFLP